MWRHYQAMAQRVWSDATCADVVAVAQAKVAAETAAQALAGQA